MDKLKTKLVLLGDVFVGKTSLAVRFSKDEFRENQESTSGAVFFTHTIEKAGKKLQFDIWDTAGQERFRALGALYYKNAKAAVIVFDLTNVHSYERAVDWIDELHQNADPDIVIALVGNKADLGAQRAVGAELAAAFALKNGLLYFECSAKTGENVKELFVGVMEKIPVVQRANFSILEGANLEEVQQERRFDKVKSCCR